MNTEMHNDGILSMRDRKEGWIFLPPKLFLESPDDTPAGDLRGNWKLLRAAEYVTPGPPSAQEGCT